MTGPIPTSHRAVPLRARKDIQFNKATYLGQACWVVKDPVKLKYFRLDAEQYEVLQLLDGRKNIDEILVDYRQKFRTGKLTRSQIQRVTLDLYQKGLAWSTRPGQGSAMNHRGDEQNWQQTKQTLKNVLFIRLPGFDPTLILSAGYWLAKWAFHPAVMLWATMMIVYSWLFMLTHATELGQRLPSWESLTTWECTIVLWLVIGVTKIVHELGHAFACRHAGGECHEIGMAFLVFSPCLYCDVSDSWTLQSKWQRMGIALAGIYVELVIATVAFFGWWNSQPGDFHQICFLVFVVSSISTLLFNLNPLLRLDGYYILSDWLEIPNLRQQADKALENAFLRTCMGMEVETESLPTKTKLFFVVYSIASMFYRSFLVVVICCLLYSFLKPYRLEYAGLMLAGLSVVIGATSWIKRIRNSVKKHRNQFGSRRQIRPYVATLLLAGVLVIILLVPVPIKLQAPLQMQYVGAQHIYANSDGQLIDIHVRPGQHVHAGQLLLDLFNYNEAERLNQLTTKKQIQEIELRKHQVLVDAEKTAIAQENLVALESEIADLQDRLQNLQIHAPRSGIIIERPRQEPTPGSKRKLSTWHGTPTDHVNRGCHFSKGAHLLTIAPRRDFQAVLTVDQLDVHAIRIGQNVRIKLTHLPHRTFVGKIERVSSASVDSARRDTGATDRATTAVPDNQYLAIVQMVGDQSLFLPGIQGRAKVTIESQTAAEWIWRNVKSTFNFQI